MNKATNKAVAVGGGLALAAALIAGAYFLYGKDGAKNRKKVRSWMLKMKGEVLEQIENAPEISEALYGKLIEEVASRYKALKNVDPKELQDTIRELKGHWAKIKKQMTTKAKTAKKVVKATAKKTVAKAKAKK